MRQGDTTLLIYILLGQVEKSRELEEQPTGYHTIRWNASNLLSGIYFYRLQAGNYVQTRKMVLLKWKGGFGPSRYPTRRLNVNQHRINI